MHKNKAARACVVLGIECFYRWGLECYGGVYSCSHSASSGKDAKIKAGKRDRRDFPIRSLHPLFHVGSCIWPIRAELDLQLQQLRAQLNLETVTFGINADEFCICEMANGHKVLGVLIGHKALYNFLVLKLSPG